MLEPVDRTPNRTLVGLAVLVLWVLRVGIAPPLDATISPQLSLADLTRAADAIVLATAIRGESLWVDRDLVTRVTLEVESTLQGTTADRIHVLVSGGVDADRRIPIASVVPGQPRIHRGERMLLFLRALETGPAEYSLVGDAQGRFVLLPDASTETVATRDLSALHLVTGDEIVRGSATAVPLSHLVERIRRLLAANRR